MAQSAAREIIIHDIQQKLDGLSTPTIPSIHKIDSQYRRVGSDYLYEPEILSVGPYYHGKSMLQHMELFKYMYLKRLLRRNNELSVDRFVDAVAAREEEARKCYDQPIKLDKQQLVTLLVLDGIFLIEFFRLYGRGIFTDKNDPISREPRILAQLNHDILLLENQLPFFILNLLFDLTRSNESTNANSDSNNDLVKLAIRFFGSRGFLFVPDLPTNWPGHQRIDHLCGLMHDACCLSFVNTISSQQEVNNSIYVVVDQICSKIINSVSGLREAGIKFQAAPMQDFLDIKFTKGGVLKIPQLRIFDETESQLRNLIVHEQYSPPGEQKSVSDYSFFIHCLIKTSNDVEFLRSHGIISNCLGNDEDVCQMFNRLGKHVLTSNDFSYKQIFRSLNSHCDRRRNKWKANLMKKYFNSPWSITSFVAALALLILAAFQTVYTILSYYKR